MLCEPIDQRSQGVIFYQLMSLQPDLGNKMTMLLCDHNSLILSIKRAFFFLKQSKRFPSLLGLSSFQHTAGYCTDTVILTTNWLLLYRAETALCLHSRWIANHCLLPSQGSCFLADTYVSKIPPAQGTWKFTWEIVENSANILSCQPQGRMTYFN